MVGVPGFEPGTYRLGGDRSIHLSYTPGILIIERDAMASRFGVGVVRRAVLR